MWKYFFFRMIRHRRNGVSQQEYGKPGVFCGKTVAQALVVRVSDGLPLFFFHLLFPLLRENDFFLRRSPPGRDDRGA